MVNYWIAQAKVNERHLHEAFVTCNVWFTNSVKKSLARKIARDDKIALIVGGAVFAHGVVVSEKATRMERKEGNHDPVIEAVFVEWKKYGGEKIKVFLNASLAHRKAPAIIKAVWGDEA